MAEKLILSVTPSSKASIEHSSEQKTEQPNRLSDERDSAQKTGEKILNSVQNQGNLAEEESTPVDEIRHWSQKYAEDERDFARFAERQQIATPEDRSKYEKRLLAYEHDIKFHWGMLEDETAAAMSDGLRLNLYQRAEVQQIGTSTIEPSKSIEAALGVFYDQRMQELSDQIRSVNNADTAKDLALAGQTWKRVRDYLEASQDIELLQMDANGYHRTRTACHNNMIQQLNALNQLAQKYGTTPFTPRKFMDNNFAYNGRLDKGGWLNSRAEYDRETVMQYFTKAFQKDFSRAAENIRRRSSRIG